MRYKVYRTDEADAQYEQLDAAQRESVDNLQRTLAINPWQGFTFIETTRGGREVKILEIIGLRVTLHYQVISRRETHVVIEEILPTTLPSVTEYDEYMATRRPLFRGLFRRRKK